MKLILRADMETLGRLGDIVEVKEGYGRNYLLPQGLAMPATASNLKVFELERKKLQAKMEAARGAASSLAAGIEALEIVIPMRVGDNDKLYGSVTSAMIAEELAKAGVEVDRRRILLDTPIRTLGDFEVRVRLHADINAKIRLKIKPEDRGIYDDKPAAAQDNSAAPPDEATGE